MQPENAWPRFHEPLGRTLRRNVAIALVVGAALALRGRALGLWLPLSALALCFSLGGHYVEVAFLNGLRPRLPRARAIHVGARVLVWFAGGGALFLVAVGMARFLPLRPPRVASWWLGGLFLIGLELAVHGTLALRRRPNFYAGNR